MKFLILFLLSAPFYLSSQNLANDSVPAALAYQKDFQFLQVGIGFPNLQKFSFAKNVTHIQSVDLKYKTTGVGPYFLKYEYALLHDFGIGLSLGYYTATQEQIYSYVTGIRDPITGKVQYYDHVDKTAFDLESYSIGARFNYHFGKKKKIDPYGGVALGYTHTTIKFSFESTNPNKYATADLDDMPIPVYIAFTLGLRAYVQDNIGLYAEVGIDKGAIIQGGLAIKIN